MDKIIGIMMERLLLEKLQKATLPSLVFLRGPVGAGKTALSQRAFPDYKYFDLRDSRVRSEALKSPEKFLSCVGNEEDAGIKVVAGMSQKHGRKKHFGMILDHLESLTTYESKKLACGVKAVLKHHSSGGFRWVFVQSCKSFSVFHTGIPRDAYAIYDLLPPSYAEIVSSPARSFGETLFCGSSLCDSDMGNSDMAGYMADLTKRHGLQKESDLFKEFVSSLGGWVSYPLDKSQLAEDCAISSSVLEDWLKILEEEFVIFPLPPLKDRLGIHLAKETKYFFYDNAFLCWLLNISSPFSLGGHIGASTFSGSIFKNWVISEVMKSRALFGDFGGCYYYEDRKKRRADMVINYPSLNPIIVHVDIGQTALLAIMGRSGQVREHIKKVKGITPSLEIVYGGAKSYQWTHHRFLSWKDLSSTDFSSSTSVAWDKGGKACPA